MSAQTGTVFFWRRSKRFAIAILITKTMALIAFFLHSAGLWLSKYSKLHKRVKICLNAISQLRNPFRNGWPAFLKYNVLTASCISRLCLTVIMVKPLAWQWLIICVRNFVLKPLNHPVKPLAPKIWSFTVQYTSTAFRRKLKQYGVIQSMSGTGRCHDNARTESFFATLKKEKLYQIKIERMSMSIVKSKHFSIHYSLL